MGHDRQGTAKLVAQLQVVRNAQAVVDRGDDLGRCDGIGIRPGPDLVARPVDVSRLDATASQHQPIAKIPVIAPGGWVDLGAATELAHDNHQRAVEHLPQRKIVQQAGDRHVELGQQGRLERPEVIAVGVPGGVGVRCPRDARDSRTGLDQPAREQDALSIDVPPITVAGARILQVDPERLAHRGALSRSQACA